MVAIPHLESGSMNDPTAMLRSEHVAIEGLLTVLEAMAKRLRGNEPVPREDLLDAMTVIVDFADRCHQIKEEDLVFPALSSASPLAGADLARRLTDDHHSLRRLIASLRDLLPRASSTKTARAQFGRDLGTYARLLREHIRVEDKTLLPEFERTVGSAERARIAREFDRLEREDVGWGLHEAYAAIIRRLGEAYPAASPSLVAVTPR